MHPIGVTNDVLERLLDDADPALRAKVLADLLDRAADDPAVVAAPRRAGRGPASRTARTHTCSRPLLLGEAGAPRTEVIDAGLEIVRAKRGRDGMRKMVGGLNGKSMRAWRVAARRACDTVGGEEAR